MPINDHLANPPRQGMIVRSKIVLDAGTTLFKLGDRFDNNVRQDDLQVISKPWWFSEGTVELINDGNPPAMPGDSQRFDLYGGRLDSQKLDQ